MKKSKLLIIAILFSLRAIAQMDTNFCERNIFPQGPLLLYHTYSIHIDSSFKGFITFNDSILEKESSNIISFFPTTNGILKVYGIHQRGDTFLIKQVQLWFRNPEFTVLLNGKESGSIVGRDRMDFYSIEPTILNNDISMRIPIQMVSAKFYVNHHLATKVFSERNVPREVIKQVLSSDEKILILDITLHLPNGNKQLPPSIFFLDRK